MEPGGTIPAPPGIIRTEEVVAMAVAIVLVLIAAAALAILAICQRVRARGEYEVIVDRMARYAGPNRDL
jgi:hypothetical protein